ncbi:MAG TPA: GNAT family N-acetyltransferase [Pseudonocardia sp.]|jgi:RimJ/RimL family protein N-acetyltransferase|nr:GNAT family N-acetyltransferase [Pseudonocardia sp.]
MGLWRVHVELEDRPGRLGDLAAAVGGSGCNIVSLTVHGERGPDGTVTDELMVDARDEAAATALADRIRRADIGCTLAVPVLAGELRDPVTTALALARRVARNPDAAAAAVASLLHARPLNTGDEAPHVHRMRVLGREVRLGRSWPFTATEASRAAMLVEMAELNAVEGADPHAAMGTVMLGDGSEVELRMVDASHTPLVAALHARCTPATRRARFLNPSPTLSPDELAELISGSSGKGDGVVALTLDGGSAVGLVTLDPDGRGSASLSVLVEDSWQVRGVGTALIRRAVEVATDAGWHELVAQAHPGNLRITRLVRRAGLRPSAQLVDGLLRIRVPLSMT